MGRNGQYLPKWSEGKRFRLDIRVVHVRDLNFILWLEIFVNFDGQLRASHLILGYTPVYSTWQPFRQALLEDSSLPSYIDVQHLNFLPLNLTVGEARDLGPQLSRENSLVPVRDASANSVFQGRAIHKPVEEPYVVAQPSKQEETELINSSEVEAKQEKGNMEAAEDADREKALKDVAEATAKDKGKAAKDTEKRSREAKKARV
ncbi:hypothetical protein SO802_012743 [Lithocarpus litseifolius]|uniref:Uncharacterized protein n=1 Tax=Lithocarpus litseifolius TaxID=425828 RepID=A0AAW2D3M2_9ROSI